MTFVATAYDSSRQVNFAGDNYGPIVAAGRHHAQPVRQLPPVPSDFVGRRRETAKIVAWAAEAKGFLRLINVFGAPATGKSTLAISAAHSLPAEFQDWQIYLNLRLPDGGMADVAAVLGGLLIAMGQPSDEIPAGQQARTGLFRSLVAGKHLTLVIDNASGITDVEPLLPGNSQAVVIVTSWAPLAELPGVRILPLEGLDLNESLRLLAKVSGRPNRPGDKESRLEVARMAAGNPLAIRIAGAILRVRPQWGWPDLLNRLRSTEHAVEGFSTGQLSLQAAFSLAYNDLSAPVARGYRILGLAAAQEMPGEVARALIGDTGRPAAAILDDLVVRQLVEEIGDDRFRMHALLWNHAALTVREAESPEQLAASITRMAEADLRIMRRDYLPRFLAAHDRLPSLDGSQTFTMAELYTEPEIEDGERRCRLADIFPRPHPRLLLLGAGGAGKTVLLSHLCSAVAAGSSGATKVPLLLRARDLARDLASGRGGDLTTQLVDMLRYQYELALTPQALEILLDRGEVLVAVDALDEVADPVVRQGLLAQIQEFCVSHPGLPVVVTSRDLPRLAQAMPELHPVWLAPWGEPTIAEFLRKLHDSSWHPTVLGDGQLDWGPEPREEWLRRMARVIRMPALSSTPLGVLIAAEVVDRSAFMPRDFMDAIGSFLSMMLGRRDVRRSVSRSVYQIGLEELLAICQTVAYEMQVDPVNRTYISLADLCRTIRAALRAADIQQSFGVDEIVPLLVSAYGLLVDAGRTKDGPIFAFAHTAFREYLAAAYIEKHDVPWLAAKLVAMSADASSRAVIRMALEMVARGRRHEVERLARQWRQAGADDLAILAEEVLAPEPPRLT